MFGSHSVQKEETWHLQSEVMGGLCMGAGDGNEGAWWEKRQEGGVSWGGDGRTVLGGGGDERAVLGYKVVGGRDAGREG
ncbi:hypothetical protein E2C01_061896 [Portunus trituberculatus]|uniref:Uncharacterized protein n=1 Tax=Portunus trituberculatus TaxID=210409 RepID=A0A5B7HDN1_PORTR|nr:hypothetical protein [Portunus trituberculatus]